ncbi:uncharacterized protein LOC131435555 [Malaya genurostris]|uniref:uncharacterized protein LOC131435555 n=1 Tax=Malaya genurostris TaxID=325434 RepID=UPI0026F3A8A1|nr:uncharacterized protein LOC131435555 [Malaya genurostris]
MSSKDSEQNNITSSNAFANITDEENMLTSPKAVGVGKSSTDGDVFMSDDEGKVLTTLESSKPSSVPKERLIIHSQTIIKPAGVVGNGPSPTTQAQKDDLLAKMKSRLSKQIDLKMVPTTPKGQSSQSQHDTSGSIEIPHDLILGSDIPATPLASGAAKGELEDHDLIAILEGDDVEITENATEIEVTVGAREAGMYNEGQVLEEIQISFVDEQDIETEQKEREKEIAMRQMANLPTLPKGRRPKPRLQDPTATSTPTLKMDSTPKVTIKGQTTIKPVPRPLLIPKKEPVDEFVIPAAKVVSSTSPLKNRIVTSPVLKTSPRDIKSSPNELISSLVSDWDDEPVVFKEEPVSPVKPIPKQSLPMLPPPPPPPFEEQPKRSRIIKKKIIWDPDNPETHMSFASFIKSNRTKEIIEEPKPKQEVLAKPAPVFRPPGTGIRRKRAESVAVHMMKDPPYTPPQHYLKRARTPEPVAKKPLTSNTQISKGSIIGRKKKSEIEKLLGDEGAINMLYDVECENSNKDLLKDSDITLDSDDEDEKLLAKAKIITDAVIKQGTSPTDIATVAPRVRTKRASTPQQQTSVSPAPMTVHPATNATAPSTSRKSAGPSNGAARKRKQTNTASDDWDYVYKSRKTCDDAMIIRRRSNSSYSSSTSPRRLSVEQLNTSNETSADKSSTFEFVKPNDKSPSKDGNLKVDSSLVANMKGKLSKVLGSKPKKDELSISIPSSSEKKDKVSPKPTKSIKSDGVTTIKLNEKEITSVMSPGETLQSKLNELTLKELRCNQCGNYVEVVLAPRETKLKDVFTIELINELKSVLIVLKSSPSVRAVLIRSSGKHFCRGIDVSYLIQTNGEKRRTAAQVYSGHLRNFLQTLAMFNKPLVAAVHGDVLGLGVTILPLFECVIAPDSTTFSTPYAQFGHLPEAMKIFSTAKNLKPKALTDLLYLNKKVSSTTALDYGLITEVVPPEKMQDRANSVTKRLSSFSLQGLRSIKSNLRQELLAHLDEHLIAEQKKLSQQWITVECQDKFKQFLSKGGEW